MAATMSYLSDRFQISKRFVKEFTQAVFDVLVSLGTVAALEQQINAALAAAHDQSGDAVHCAPVKNADETGWKQAGARR